MTEVEVTNTIDVTAMPGDTAVVVVLEDNVEIIQTFEQGPPGPQGPPGGHGDKGEPGNTVLYGPADPLNHADGEDGNFWINTTTHFIFGPRVNGIWPAGTSMIGPQGIPGNTVLYGAADPVAGTGVDGNFYINTATHFMFGPKAAGAWPAGFSLIGPQGPKGDKGDTGGVGPAGPGIAEPADANHYARQNGAWIDTKLIAVRVDIAQPALTSPQRVQGRQNIYAAPFDAMGYSGIQINGGFEVTQERVAGTGFAGSGYFADGWGVARAGTHAGYAYTSGPLVPNLPSSLGSYLTTAQAVMGAADYLVFYHQIEGSRMARLAWGTAAAWPLTLAFWSSHTRTGLYTGVFKNPAANRVFAFTYNQTVSNAVEFHAITIDGCTDGAWPKDNTTGAYVQFAMAAGSTWSAPVANAWLTGTNYVAGPGQINGIAALTDNFRLAGVALLPGLEAPPQDRLPFVMRPFDQELLLCQRFYEKSFPYLIAPAGNTGTAGAYGFAQLLGGANSQTVGTIGYSVSKRATPTLTLFNPYAANNQIRNVNQALDWSNSIVGSQGEQSAVLVGTGASGSSQGASCSVHWVADARL